MARLMEGSWHVMLANVSRVPPPPYCPLKGGNQRWSNSVRDRHHLQQRLEQGANSARGAQTADQAESRQAARVTSPGPEDHAAENHAGGLRSSLKQLQQMVDRTADQAESRQAARVTSPGPEDHAAENHAGGLRSSLKQLQQMVDHLLGLVN